MQRDISKKWATWGNKWYVSAWRRLRMLAHSALMRSRLCCWEDPLNCTLRLPGLWRYDACMLCTWVRICALVRRRSFFFDIDYVSRDDEDEIYMITHTRVHACKHKRCVALQYMETDKHKNTYTHTHISPRTRYIHTLIYTFMYTLVVRVTRRYRRGVHSQRRGSQERRAVQSW
jgi:hypothetical protein